MRWKSDLISIWLRRAVSTVVVLAGIGVTTAAASGDINNSNGNENTKGKVEDGFFEQLQVDQEKEQSEGLKLKGDNWAIKGTLKQKFVYSLDEPVSESARRDDDGISQSRTVADVKLDGRVSENTTYRINPYMSLDRYSTWDDGFEWREAYFSSELTDEIWLKFGRQIVAWGQSDFYQLLDQANPRDIREIGLVEAEDIRIPVLSTKISFVKNRWGLDLVLNHEFRGHKLAQAGDDFDPYVGLREQFKIVDENDPDLGYKDPEVLARAFFSFSWGDVDLIFADVYNDYPVLKLDDTPGQLASFYRKTKVAGFDASYINDKWLYKTEWAYKSTVDQVLDDFSSGELTDKKPELLGMLGADYTVSGDAVVSFEWMWERILNYSADLSPDRTRNSFVASSRIEFLHDLVTLNLVWGHWIEENSDVFRISADYDITDSIELSGGYLTYHAEDKDSLLYYYKNNDEVYFSVQFGFQ